MRKFAFLAVAALIAVPALAQATPDSFNGPFVGVQGGWQQDRQTLDVTSSFGTSKDRQNNSGFGYGGQIGYDFLLNPNIVLGAEAALTGRTGSNPLEYNSDFTISQGRTVAATARFGYLIGVNGLVYARGGYTNARYKLRNRFGDYSQNHGGYTVGAGYEQQLRRNVSARIEYAYSKFGAKSLPGLANGIGATDARLGYSRNEVKAGLNFRF
jgi:outer membrane immunogenic protein